MREALGNVRFVRRAVSGGCTSGWNDGLVWARLEGFSTVLLANDDVVFGPGWDVGLDEALRDADLVGPLSNAPGLTSPAVQGVRRLLPAYEPSDDPDKIREVSEALTSLGAPPEKAPVNGFCMAGRVASLWRCAYSDEFVFDPKFPMEGNETEFQNRASVLGFRTSVSSTSFVFHYRSVSRPAKNRRGLWFRPSRGGFDW
jgi:GT2 family glycosyltransferase